MEQFITDGLRALSDSAPAAMLRQSFWVYPIVNASHILGIAFLVGGILPLNLRLMGFIQDQSVRSLAKICVPVAATGLGLAMISGLMLFSVKPVDYIGTEIFVAKLTLIAAAVINIVIVRFNASWRNIKGTDELGQGTDTPDRALQIAGAVSLLIWISVLFLGRFVGYVM